MLKRTTVVASLLASSLLLVGCSSGGTPDASPSPTATESATPSLKVPETATGTTATLMVNGGDLEKGTTATLYRFNSGWDDGPVQCDDSDAETREIRINGDGNDQTVSFPVAPGIVSWVLVAGDFTTPCDGPGARTTVLISTNVLTLVGEDDARTPVGAEKTIRLDGMALPETIPVTATVAVLGPWSTLPEAEAASCVDAPEAGSSDVEMFKEPGKIAFEFETTFTPEEAGVYRVVTTLPETAQSTEFDTCADESDPVTFVVGE